VPCGSLWQVFPEDRLEGDGGGELALKSIQNPHSEKPLETNVAGGREEDADRSRGHDTGPAVEP
jgi:hypothetical protein